MEYSIGTKVFDGWEITRMLGEGSYGKVFAIEKTDFGFTTRAALKLIRIPKSPTEIREALSEGMDEKTVTTYFEEIVERFVREIAVMSQLKGHPNVVSCENYKVEPHVGTIGWDILIKMELLTSLSDYQLEHPADENQVRRMAEDICRALVFIQKHGLIHRDIKPANIFVDSLGQFKLGDFGVARTSEITLGGMSKQGTENYMAPEVYHGKPYGFSVDIYSLGLVLYRLMNGNRLPFYPPAPQRIGLADRENALISRMKGDPLPAPVQASPEFAAIILKACAHNPKERYQTAGEMLEALTGMASPSVAPPAAMDEAAEPPAPEDDVGTVNVFAAPPAPQADEDDGGTVNIFAAPPAPQADEDDGGTVNIFAAPPAPRADEDDGGTVNIFAAPPTPRADEDDGGTVNVFAANPTPVVTEPAEENRSRENAMLAFWKQNLTKLWGVQKEARWKAYFAPDIPLQICSNAIFNITESREKKDQILAVLDCTPDSRIPCGCGVVVTPKRMYISLLIQNANAQKYPMAVLEFNQLKRVWSGIQKGPLWIKYPSLFWETKTGKSFRFGVNMYQFVNYSALEKLLNSAEWKACLETE